MLIFRISCKNKHFGEIRAVSSDTIEHCYMCEQLSTSREHVPPKNLFPEEKDVGEDFRKNLVTVPSCDLHNASKSKDDEFLMVSLAGIVGNNSIGYKHGLTKVDRAFRRSAGRLLDKVVVKKKKIHRFEIESNKFFDVIWGTPDVIRLKKCFDHIARGLYYHHFTARFDGETHIMLGYLSHDDPSARNWSEFIRDRAELDLVGKQFHGENSKVFFYQLTDVDVHGIFLMRLCFYGGLNVYISFVESTLTPPANLAMELMKKGVKTIFEIGDKRYEIN